eukprot:31463-Pelagococcus_subviridis.AAC.10
MMTWTFQWTRGLLAPGKEKKVMRKASHLDEAYMAQHDGKIPGSCPWFASSITSLAQFETSRRDRDWRIGAQLNSWCSRRATSSSVSSLGSPPPPPSPPSPSPPPLLPARAAAAEEVDVFGFGLGRGAFGFGDLFAASRSRCSSRASLAGSGWKTSSVNFRFDAAMPVAATAAAASDGENGERGAVTFSVTAVTSHSGCSSFGPKIFVFRLGN